MKHLPFDYNGTEITDATTDESGRFSVNPVEYYGQEFIDAWQCQLVYELLEKLKKATKKQLGRIVHFDDTSWHNDLCPSVMAQFWGQNIDDGGNEPIGDVRIWLPNHPVHNPDYEDIATYSVTVDKYGDGITYVADDVHDVDAIVKIAMKTIKKYF
jgi:hypothetical protein